MNLRSLTLARSECVSPSALLQMRRAKETPFVSMSHANGERFRKARWHDKIAASFSRDKQDINRRYPSPGRGRTAPLLQGMT